MLHCILDSYPQTVLCMHVYTFDVYSYTRPTTYLLTYLLTSIIVICSSNSECVLTFVGNREMNEMKMTHSLTLWQAAKKAIERITSLNVSMSENVLFVGKLFSKNTTFLAGGGLYFAGHLGA